jgi:hypothetical protein
VVLDGKPDWREVARLVREAYLHVAARKEAARLRGSLARYFPRTFSTWPSFSRALPASF